MAGIRKLDRFRDYMAVCPNTGPTTDPKRCPGVVSMLLTAVGADGTVSFTGTCYTCGSRFSTIVYQKKG